METTRVCTQASHRLSFKTSMLVTMTTVALAGTDRHQAGKALRPPSVDSIPTPQMDRCKSQPLEPKNVTFIQVWSRRVQTR